MKVAICYESATGNTAQVAQAIRQACGEETILTFGGPADVSQADLVFAGYWVNKGICSPEMEAFFQTLSGKKVALFATAGAAGEPYFHSLEERARKLLPPDARVLGAFYCQGRMSPGIRAGYLAQLKEDPDNPRLKASLANFDQAQSHPDQTDLDGAGDFARQMLSLARQ